MSHFDLNLLRIVLAVHDEGSVSSAAAKLGISQPAVSAALSRLRRTIGDPLFVKTSRGMDPTSRVLALVDTARDVLAQVDSAILAKHAFDPATTTEVFAFAMSDIGEMVFLPKIIDQLQRHAPHATVRSLTLPPAQVEHGLQNGTIDLAIGYFPDLKKKSFFQQRLFTHHFVCLLRADHPIRSQKLSLTQFQSLGHAVVRAEGRSQEVFERFLEKQRIRCRIVLSTPHFMGIPMIIARSDLVATVPHALGIYGRQLPVGLRIAEPPLNPPGIELKQHWHRKYHHEPKIVWLRGIVAELFNDTRDEWRDL